MRIEQSQWFEREGWRGAPPGGLGGRAQLALLFGDTSLIKRRACFEEIRGAYPKALLFGCSTAGEIHGSTVSDGSLSVTAAAFEHTGIEAAHVLSDGEQLGYEAGYKLVKSFDPEDLAHVFLLSAGLGCNAGELVAGVADALPAGVAASGGLAGDGDRFRETYVLCGGRPEGSAVAALGFYGSRIRVGYGFGSGWDPFGPDRLITRSKSNVLYEFDGCSALGLYKRYLGEYARGLPATALLFPITVALDNGERVVRTILSVSEADQSMTFAGDIPEGRVARFMKANVDHLVDGATAAAGTAAGMAGGGPPQLTILVSCVGRKLVMKQRIEEESEAAREAFGDGPAQTGFYSYGEIAPFALAGPPALHNESMTVTAFRED
ncbi:MAG: FIST C-terminal domain-containing protein [Acidobacteriia bacterium]|nr:FIST C-terminal domain-containing protein [Terriglobia bacterium]